VFRTLVSIALRNLLAHKVKTGVVGIILLSGTVLVLLGASLLTTIDHSMSESLIGSIAGHLQISSAKGKDKLVLFPGPVDGTDFGHLEDFPTLRKEIEALPEVEAVIPMGFSMALVFGGNLVDVKLQELREAHGKEDKERYVAVRDHVKRIVKLLSHDMKNLEAILDPKTVEKGIVEGIKDVRTAAVDAWWADFDEKWAEKIVFLENKVARMAIGEDLIPMRFMGTDPERFSKHFSRFEIARGQMIPKGKRGFLFAEWAYEEFIKHKTARRLDKMKDALADGDRLATDEKLQEMRKQNGKQYKEVTYQLDDASAAEVATALRKLLGSGEQDLVKLVQAFFDCDDDNFGQRYKFFYDVIAPHLQLYKIGIGDHVTLRGVAKGGYPTSVHVKAYGTFRFKSLEKSALAGAVHVMDIHSFRDLYGHLTADKKEELEKIKEDSGVEDVNRDSAEDDLFGGGDDEGDEGGGEAVDPASEGTAAGFDEFAGVDMDIGAATYAKRLEERVYTEADIEGGIVNNAAVVLKSRGDIRSVKAQLTERSEKDKLEITVQTWQEASGTLGYLVFVIWTVLVVAILGVFGVALFIVNNSMVMATMERTREIGTMRAIGAQRRMILGMFLTESLTIGTVFGAIGVVVGLGIIGVANAQGIPAVNDFLVFLFGGPRLHPETSVTHVVVAMILVVLVTVVSSLYPAWLATRVPPVEAMSEE